MSHVLCHFEQQKFRINVQFLTNQISASHYFEDTSQEVVNDSLNQLTNIYNGRVMVIDDQLRVVKDTYSLDEGKLDVSESVVRCMEGDEHE